MKRLSGHAVVVAGLLFLLSVTPGWGGGLPITNDDSTADGKFNTGGGTGAFVNNTTGSLNTAVGRDSGLNLTSGDNNIYLGSVGPTVAGSESATLRLGSTQTRAFITGVFGTVIAPRAIPVRINSTGQLGTRPSSVRYKRDIEAMGGSSEKLLQLRPVSFTYKEDPEKVRQYGLIAEEVAKVYPELVTHTATGEVEGVDYEALIPMLLNELQRQQQELHEVAKLKQELASLREVKQELATLRTELAQMLEQRAQHAAGVTHTASLAGR